MDLKNIDNLPYRNNVSLVIFQNNNFLIIQKVGWPDNWWKFPQGGVEDGETEEMAVHREFLEELGNENFKVIAKSSFINKYDWSTDSIKKAGYKWRGQTQRFFLLEYLGNDKEIVIDKNEILQYKWVDLKDLFNEIDNNSKDFVNYKDSVKKALLEFKLF